MIFSSWVLALDSTNWSEKKPSVVMKKVWMRKRERERERKKRVLEISVDIWNFLELSLFVIELAVYKRIERRCH